MKWYGWAGVILLCVSEYCLFYRIDPFYSWFYCFAWWSYILVADSLLFRLRGRSLFVGRRRELMGMLLLSIFIWLIFEMYNLVIHNWAYREVISNIWLRWAGYSLAFATVLPGIFITSDLLEIWLFGDHEGPGASEADSMPGKPGDRATRLFLFLGIFLSTAPLIWPRYFFATIWLGPIFVLDPLLEKMQIRSLSLSISSGSRRRVWSLLLGGLACGLMWEFWNFWAPSKWIYSVPFFSRWKVFEMPVLGFLGFPPFALECWILYHLISAGIRRAGSAPLRAALWLLLAACCLLIFYGIDRRTVVSFAGSPAFGYFNRQS
jgi:hypothetical protein